MNFRAIALGGLSWTLSSQFWRMALQIFTTIILARLLTPDDFGVYAMALPVIALANLLQDIGLNQSMISKPDLSIAQANRLFWINLRLSLGLAVALSAAAPWIGDFYHEPRLVPVLCGWALVLSLGALGFGQYAMLARQFRFRLLAIIDMICAGLSFVTVLGVASVWPTYWALWFSGLVSVLVWVVLSWTFSGWRPSARNCNGEIGGLFSFGLNIGVHNVANFFVRNFDNVLIGRVLGSATLGLYDRAYKLLLYPIENLGNPIGRVMIPILSRMQGDSYSYRRAYLQASGCLSLMIMPGMMVAILCAPDVVRILLGERWSAVAAIFSWLGVAGLVHPVLVSTEWLFLSQGRGKDLMRASVFSAVVMSAGFVIGVSWGAVGVAAAYAIAEITVRVPLQVFLAGRGFVRHRDIFMEYAPQVLACCVSFGMIAGLKAFGVHGWLLIVSSLLLAYANAFACMSLFDTGRVVLASGWRVLTDVLDGVSKRHAP